MEAAELALLHKGLAAYVGPLAPGHIMVEDGEGRLKKARAHPGLNSTFKQIKTPGGTR